MSWHDPEGPWSRKLRRRVRVQALSCAVFVLPVVVVLSLSWWAHQSTLAPGVSGLSDNLLLIAVVPIGLMEIVVLAVFYRIIRRERAVLRNVPAHDGMVCPRCRAILAASQAESRCPICEAPYSRDALQSYWADYALAPEGLRPWVAKKNPRRRFPYIGRPRLADIRVQLLFFALIFVAATLAMWSSTGISFWGTVVRYTPYFFGMLLFQVGGVACISRYFMRKGLTRHCAACDYQRVPEGENSERCPECGADWSRPGGVVTGVRQRDPRYLWIGAAVCVVAVLGMMSYLNVDSPGGSWALRAIPTPSLIHDTTTSGGFTIAEWKELRRRTLTPAEDCQLAQGLLDKRLRRDYLDTTEGGWLWTQVATNALPKPLADRYYHEMLDVWIDVPTTIRKGESLQASLGSIFRLSNLPVGIEAVVYFGGFAVDDNAARLARSDRCMFAGLLDEPKYRFHAKLEPSQEGGAVHLRAVLYFAIGRGLNWSMTPVPWAEDDTAILPASVIWSLRIEIEKVIQVTE